MREDFLKEHFDRRSDHYSGVQISKQEQDRIAATHLLIPDNWKSLVDVGCGDGRVSNPLFSRGIEVLGVDWSENSLEYCEFPTISADITKLDIHDKSYDGAICAEVLEHLPEEQGAEVIKTMQRITRHGFIVSVPAREILLVGTVQCSHCREDYHVYGHLRSFRSFEDVDRMVGSRSVDRQFVANRSVTSMTVARLRRYFGVYDYVENALCPYCGTALERPPHRSLQAKILFKLITKPISFVSKLRPLGDGLFAGIHLILSRWIQLSKVATTLIESIGV